MNETILRLERPHATHGLGKNVSLGRHLIESGLISPWQLFHALEKQMGWDANLTEILCSKGWITEAQALQALSTFYTAQIVDLFQAPPQPELQSLMPASFCIKYNILPWQKVGGLLIVVTGRPDRFEELRTTLPGNLRNAIVALAPEDMVSEILATLHRQTLVELAEARVPAEFSCREFGGLSSRHVWRIAIFLAAMVAAMVFVPAHLFAALTLLAVLSMIAVSLMKLTAFVASLGKPAPLATPSEFVAPRISVLVPLFREKEIAHALIARLSRLTYPKALLDVLLVLEEHDTLTQETIAHTNLPQWMRVVVVPAGSGLTTKPRALNYALDFCKGDIIGIWDAEDAPAPNQLEVVALRFAQAHPNTVCLQGILDYYNPWSNWLSRCFTIEYATWFRTVLPGLARLGFAIPLGGTTLFIKRQAIEALGGWDAHNVTEDADLGMRIARFGFRTELLETVTQEEAACRPFAWVKQRSRWLKGYMVTYLVHMRDPVLLWREFGPLQFLGLHLVFACTLLQFLLAPLIWLFWGGVVGIPYPENLLFTARQMLTISQIFLVFGLANAAIATRSILGQKRKMLIPFVVTMPFYFPLATLAGYKALIELIFRPFYWDKTAHAKTVEGISAHHSGIGVLLEPGHESL
ncbi:hypothetical protein SAMN05444000_102244 [Shimia gijangensis]|uniref:Type II secretion system protein GspE N-terminal domain-containing protein n=1 Tax=Shimia gijangensis TaxID=1470563 RepID=A0A1M6D6V9_9RHOB|nr:glycosyltransferase [Shimia gijangensis]SHI68930.1 hypothetical protein SAMN05444000_102244 [Shimia gijangensis]